MTDITNFTSSPLRDRYGLSHLQWCYLWLVMKRTLTDVGTDRSPPPEQTWFIKALDTASNLPPSLNHRIFEAAITDPSIDRLILLEAIQLAMLTR